MASCFFTDISNVITGLIKDYSLSLSEDLLSVKTPQICSLNFSSAAFTYSCKTGTYICKFLVLTHTDQSDTLSFMPTFSLFPDFSYSHYFFMSCFLLVVMLSFPVLTTVKTCSTVSFSVSTFVCSSNSTTTWSTKKLWNTILQAPSSWLVVVAVDQKSLIGQLQLQYETNTHENKNLHMAVIIFHFTHFHALHLYIRQFPFITSEFILFES